MSELDECIEIGRKWKQDSSLDLWFPFTASEVQCLKNEVQNSKRLLTACLNTGALRCDTHRELYEQVCKFCGIEAK